MIVCAGTIHIDPDKIEIFEKLLPAHAARTEAQEFCHLFSLGVANRQTGEVTVAEVWRDAEGLQEHHEQPFTKEFVKAWGGVQALNVKMYEISAEKPLPPIGTIAKFQQRQ